MTNEKTDEALRERAREILHEECGGYPDEAIDAAARLAREHAAALARENEELKRKGGELCGAVGNQMIELNDLRKLVASLHRALLAYGDGGIDGPSVSGFIDGALSEPERAEKHEAALAAALERERLLLAEFAIQRAERNCDARENEELRKVGNALLQEQVAQRAVVPSLLKDIAALRAARDQRCLQPNVAQCAKLWEADHQRAALARHGLVEEFPYGCDAINHVAEALVAGRAALATALAAPRPDAGETEEGRYDIKTTMEQARAYADGLRVSELERQLSEVRAQLAKWPTIECPCCGEEGAWADCFEDGAKTTCGCGGTVMADGEEAHINVPEEECPKCNAQPPPEPKATEERRMTSMLVYALEQARCSCSASEALKCHRCRALEEFRAAEFLSVAPPAPAVPAEPSFIAELPSEQDNAIAFIREHRRKHGNPFEDPPVSPRAAQGDEPDLFEAVAREFWTKVDRFGNKRALSDLLRERFGPIVNQLQGARDHLKYEANSDGGIVARIDHVLASLSSRAAGGPNAGV